MSRTAEGVPGTPWALALRRARKRRGMTQIELRDASGVAQRTISEIETGTRKPTSATIDRLARALGVGVDVLDPRATAPPPDASWAIALSDRAFARRLREAAISEILAALPLLNREAGAAMEQGDDEAKLRAVRRFMDASREWQDRMGPLREAPTTATPPPAGESKAAVEGEVREATA